MSIKPSLEELLQRINYDGRLLSSPQESLLLTEKIVEAMHDDEEYSFIIKFKSNGFYTKPTYLPLDKDEVSSYNSNIISLCSSYNLPLPKPSNYPIQCIVVDLTKSQYYEIREEALIKWVRCEFPYSMFKQK
ncbi:hypothetical protein D6777_02290 [Candidatus Woesearchaeota archaeon]|nr:MAG: hypothetical protein D6777_02290 [Candidatus Woesearchaeota archaeon]